MTHNTNDEVIYQSPSVSQKHGSDKINDDYYRFLLMNNISYLDTDKVFGKRQPKAGDIWVCQEGAVLVFSISDIGVEYLWQDTPDEFIVDSRLIDDWHKDFDYQKNIFDCEDLKDDDPKLYKEIKEQQQMFERLTKKDQVNHPKHYTSHPSGIETIQITRHMNFNRGNAVKYLMRAGLKDPDKEVEDLQKAVWYIQDEIKRLEALNQAKNSNKEFGFTVPKFHWAYSNDDNHDK